MNRLAALLFSACMILSAQDEDASGPGRTTLQTWSWGTVYYEPASLGACTVTRTPDGLRFVSGQGQVTISGSDAMGLTLAWGDQKLTVKSLSAAGGVAVRSGAEAWTLAIRNGDLTLTSSAPADTVSFSRGVNTFTIQGGLGTVKGTSKLGDVTIVSPLGTTAIVNRMGSLTFSGPPLAQVPYLGRGLFLPFHGVGVFLDLGRFFPLPEVAQWVRWRPVL